MGADTELHASCLFLIRLAILTVFLNVIENLAFLVYMYTVVPFFPHTSAHLHMRVMEFSPRLLGDVAYLYNF